jgi:flagellar hook-basal body complex protein FliE
MSNMQIDAVLSQIRSLSAQVQGQVQVGSVSAAAAPGLGKANNEGDGFAALMRQGINQVNEAQQRSGRLATEFERGTPGVELADVMLQSQKASVSFRALTEVRNRLVSVYQEVMSMQI